MDPLPIDAVLPRLAAVLRERTAAVLVAPPGAGKTTRVPLALLEEPWARHGRIVLLEPRRMAARAAAWHMADLLGETTGATVGYRIRRERSVGPGTRVEVVTEGILTRMLQDDPALEGVGVVIFDEFHERSIHADLGLALALQSQAVLRPDLRLLVMSATLEAAPVARLLGDAPVVTGEGRSHAVETRYRPGREEPVERRVAAAVREALAEAAGDILAFLPGEREIRRTEALLRPSDPQVDVLPLFGSLPREAQDAALRRASRGRRKVVLATSIAETSLTIDGVRVVVDGGLARVSRFSPRTGMARLETVRVSRASADQRRGRAGRLAPGVCYRLWAEAEDLALLARATPEILEADLAPLALELAVAGVTDPSELPWLDSPPAAAHAEALDLLRELGAVDPRGRASDHGRAMARLGLHPRLAHLVLAGRSRGVGGTACDLAALLEERDVLQPESDAAEGDLRLRLELLRRTDLPASFHGIPVRRDILRRARAEARHWRRRLRIAAGADDEAAAGLLLALAYPDRVAQRRTAREGRFLLRNGQGARLGSPSLTGAEYLVAATLDGRRRESRIFLAASITAEEVRSLFADRLEWEEEIAWDAATESVVCRRRERLGALTLREAPLRDPDPEAVTRALLGWIAQGGAGLDVLPWDDASRGVRDRLRFLHALEPGWPDCSDAALLETLPAWLGPHVAGIRRRAELARLDLSAVLLAGLGWDARRRLDAQAPTHCTVPSGSRIAIDYADPAGPVLAVRLQELFGLTETPAVAGGRVPLTLHLLSPARRPVQVTRDLAGFWRSTYFEVRKDLKGRYPKHHWPDDPLSAVPTGRAKRRR